ncbi:hypothetical protein pb186bvf_016356 [Paramecium bursaria]
MSFSTSTSFKSRLTHRKFHSESDPMLYQKPLETRPTGNLFKSTFAQFLDGNIDANSLIHSLNYPKQQPQQVVEVIEEPEEQKKEAQISALKSRAKKMHDLILKRVDLKKKENQRQRQEHVQNLALVQTLMNISVGQKRCLDKQIPKTKSLKTCQLNYDDTKPISQHISRELKAEQQRPYLKNVLESNTQLYLQELQSQSERRENQAYRLIRLNIQQRKNSFRLYHKAANSNKRNHDGIMLQADLQLYDYLHNKPQIVQIQNHPKYIQNVLDNDDKVKDVIIGKYAQKKRLTPRYNTNPPDNSDDSCESSLQSACEIKLDNYYQETQQLKKKSHTQLSKRIKQLLHLDTLQGKAITTCINKLGQ